MSEVGVISRKSVNLVEKQLIQIYLKRRILLKKYNAAFEG